MSFSNLLFLVLFLPVYLLAYYFQPDIKRKNTVFLIASLVFYAFGGIRYLFLLGVMAAAGWYFGIQVGQAKGPRRKRLLALSIAVFLAVLAFFKYTGFLFSVLETWFPKIPAVKFALPLGISFYTFKLISYVADVYHERISAESNFFMILLYVCNFHQISQGPIARYGEMRGSMRKRRLTTAHMADGIWRFSLGLAKKTVLADHCGEIADTLIPLNAGIVSRSTFAVWMGAAVYSIQLYLDFSAYTDMAIGLGQMIGFSYPENFRDPYISSSVREFWRRWHITLSTFFRDFVYIPLGGNRVSSGRTVLNLLIVWTLTGLWHGAAWNFVLWGLYYFVFIALEQRGAHAGISVRNPVLRHVYTILVFTFGWLIFRYSDFGQLGGAVRGFFGMAGNGFYSAGDGLTIANNIWFLIFCVLCCTPLFKEVSKRFRNFAEHRENPGEIFMAAKSVLIILFLILSILSMTGNTYRPFLYNQF